TINIAPAPVITTAATLPSAASGLAYFQQLAVSGGAPPYTWSLTLGAPQASILLSALSGALSGSSATPSTVNFTATVTDANGATNSKIFSLTVVGTTLTILDSLPAAQVGVPYSATIHAAGGTPPYTFTLSPGASP